MNLSTNQPKQTVNRPLEIDLGCGPNKKEGTIGTDHYPYPGVDVIFDLDRFSWPFRDNQFDAVHASHVIEHVSYIPEFITEIHRICRHGAIVSIVTPHFSSLDSWKDPTHRWHLSIDWYVPFCDPRSYLTSQLPPFEALHSDVKFSSSLRNIRPRLIKCIFGVKTWEKHFSFRYPAKNIHSRLRVIKRAEK